MRPILAIAALLLLAGCGAAPALIGGALGFGASALKLDDDLFNYWAAQRAPAPAAP